VRDRNGADTRIVRFTPVLAPRVSVVTLAWKNVDLLARCLESLQRHLPHALADVVILLNGADPDVVEYVRRDVVGAKIVAAEVNLGFAGGCNRAATFATGEYLVLLNDDTEIEPGWLEALVETADACPTAGAVGSRILFPDGSLQEAGCIIWSDGTTMPIGRHEASEPNTFAHRRPVDYCSACSLLIRRSVWDALGGMDENYYPAYYEDVDFCLRVQLAGGIVIYEPRSLIRHRESASTDEHFRRFVWSRSWQYFSNKWRDVLTMFEQANPASPASVHRAIGRARVGLPTAAPSGAQ
jgi:GT2 family glycosyltransferase